MAIGSGVLLPGVAENPTFPILSALAYTTGLGYRPTCDVLIVQHVTKTTVSGGVSGAPIRYDRCRWRRQNFGGGGAAAAHKSVMKMMSTFIHQRLNRYKLTEYLAHLQGNQHQERL